MRIAIGADHRGYKLKERLKNYLYSKHDLEDFGCDSEEAVDYPDIGRKVAESVANKKNERGIVICGTGVGMSMVVNHVMGIRGALCYNESAAEKTRLHNDSNILVLGADYTDGGLAERITDKWLNTAFEGGRHERRVKKIDNPSKVSASLLSKPPMIKEAMAKFIKDIETCGIDSLHWDVMDGKYNGNNTWDYQGPESIKNMRLATKLPFVAHLMMEGPLEKIGLFNEAGCNVIIFHYEACKNDKDVKGTINKILSYGRFAGIAIEPDTTVERIVPYLSDLDEVLVMSVRTGYAGQKFMDITEKIRYLDGKRKSDGLGFKISVDGGINDVTGKLCRVAGADILAAASYIQNNAYKTAIASLR